MTPTAELREALRALLDERVPAGGDPADTLFTDAEVDGLLRGHDDLNQAAAEGWSQKAGRVMSADGGLSEIAVGAERYRVVDPVKRAEHAKAMAEMYAQRAPAGGSTVVDARPPDVLGLEEPVVALDVSRLLLEGASGRWYGL